MTELEMFAINLFSSDENREMLEKYLLSNVESNDLTEYHSMKSGIQLAFARKVIASINNAIGELNDYKVNEVEDDYT